jgi:hypothetical protein
MRKLTVLLGVSFIALVTATSPAAARSQFTCNGGYQFVTVGDLVVPPSGTCLISLSTVEGNVTVMKGGYIRASATQIGGNVKGHDALRVYLDGATRVTGDVEVKGTKETILVDSQFGDVRVQGTPNGGGDIHFFNNSIAGDVRLTHNAASMVVNLNTVGGDVQIEKNIGDLTAEANSVHNMDVSENSGIYAFVQQNKGQELRCEGNDSLFTGGPNTFAHTEGQCF